MKVSNVPTASDFHDDALSSLNHAFDTFSRFVSDHDYVIDAAGDDTADRLGHLIKSRYLFKNIINLCFSAVELELKANICELSPFLLLDGPRGWPKAASPEISFGTFRAISASDLPQATHLFGKIEYSKEAWHFFDNLRKLRNETTHSSTPIQFQVDHIFEIILDTFRLFFDSKNPFPLRTKYLESSGQSLVAPDYIRNWVVNEFIQLRTSIGAEFFKEKLEVPVSTLLPCGYCNWAGTDWDEQPGTASITGDKSNCHVCGESDGFYRAHCVICEDSQLFSEKADICLYCGCSSN